jgi:hypothetical protein
MRPGVPRSLSEILYGLHDRTTELAGDLEAGRFVLGGCNVRDENWRRVHRLG